VGSGFAKRTCANEECVSWRRSFAREPCRSLQVSRICHEFAV
jgi:hypothetical protein